MDKRGWGLFAKEFVPKGTFVIEYMGEVINKKGYERRKKEYAQVAIPQPRLLNAEPEPRFPDTLKP